MITIVIRFATLTFSTPIDNFRGIEFKDNKKSTVVLVNKSSETMFTTTETISYSIEDDQERIKYIFPYPLLWISTMGE